MFSYCFLHFYFLWCETQKNSIIFEKQDVITENIWISVVNQFYKAEILTEYVIRGNTAVLKCSIPSFVADYVYVESWMDDEGNMMKVSDNYGNFLKNLSNVSYCSSCVAVLCYRGRKWICNPRKCCYNEMQDTKFCSWFRSNRFLDCRWWPNS